MKTSLAKHLWTSPPVRSALRKEALRLFVFIALCLGFTAAASHFKGEPVRDGVVSAGIGLLAIVLVWILSVIRTIRAALRDNGLLQR